MQERSFLDYFYERLDKLNMAKPLTLSESTPLGEGIETMKSKNIGSLLVADTTGKLAGIITERDILLKVTGEEVDFKTPISDFMTRNPKFLTTYDTIFEAIELMDQGHFRHMPIVDDEGAPVGVISIKDVVDYLCAVKNEFLEI